MYNIHHTEGIILSSRDVGEADRIYTIYSKDFGKIAVFAKGVRLEKSKLRYHLNPYSLIRLSFIEGRDILRLTDAEEIVNASSHESSFYLLERISTFTLRMVHGQEKDEVLWNTLRSGFYYMYTSQEISRFFEPLFKARILHRLGYVSLTHGVLDKAIIEDDWPEIHFSDTDQKNLEKMYTESLTASQL